MRDGQRKARPGLHDGGCHPDLLTTAATRAALLFSCEDYRYTIDARKPGFCRTLDRERSAR